MIQTLLLITHIAVLGYWLGAELVINSEYRFICMRDDLPFAARDAMMDHLMNADQQVRYALILQLTLGLMLLSVAALLPSWLLWIAPCGGALWLALVETAHRTRKRSLGQVLAGFDRSLRYAVMAGLIVAALGSDLPLWLRLKLAAFAAVMACGVGIRLALIGHFRLWADMAAHGPTAQTNAAIRTTCYRASAILVLLWVFVGVIVLLSIMRRA
jgi:hypothetical protein